MRHFENQTAWDARDLRRLVITGIKAEGMDPRLYSVTIKKPRGWGGSIWVTGLGWYNQFRLNLGIPAPHENNMVEGRMSPKMVRRVTQVLVHEIGHNQGLRHKDMVPSSTIEVPWTEGLMVRVKQLKVKPRPTLDERREKKLRHAQALLEQHESRLKREQGLTRKWRSKVRYYEWQMKTAAEKGDRQ